MDRAQLDTLRACFDDYVQGFAQDGVGLAAPLLLKQQHSQRVAQECRELSLGLGWPEGLQRSAEALGLLHDLGRFSQFTQYHTFADGASVDHGERGYEIASRCKQLSRLPGAERTAILEGIRHHNDRRILEEFDGQSLDFLRLVRDADKLDIYRVVLEAIDRDGFQNLPKMLPQINLQRRPSPEVLEELLVHQSCSFERLRTLGDFLMMQLSWIYDFNFPTALLQVHDREIPARLLKHVEGDAQCAEILEKVQRFIRDRLADGGTPK